MKKKIKKNNINQLSPHMILLQRSLATWHFCRSRDIWVSFSMLFWQNIWSLTLLIKFRDNFTFDKYHFNTFKWKAWNSEMLHWWRHQFDPLSDNNPPRIIECSPHPHARPHPHAPRMDVHNSQQLWIFIIKWWIYIIHEWQLVLVSIIEL